MMQIMILPILGDANANEAPHILSERARAVFQGMLANDAGWGFFFRDMATLLIQTSSQSSSPSISRSKFPFFGL